MGNYTEIEFWKREIAGYSTDTIELMMTRLCASAVLGELTELWYFELLVREHERRICLSDAQLEGPPAR